MCVPEVGEKHGPEAGVFKVQEEVGLWEVQQSSAWCPGQGQGSSAPAQPRVAEDAPSPQGCSWLLVPEASGIQTLEETASSLKTHL